MEREDSIAVIERVEIDTSQPFKSVKEAVTLFGERVLVAEIYANKLKEMQKASEKEPKQSRIEVVSIELEETKQSLEKAKEECHFMAHCLVSLKQELEETKRELQKLRTRELLHNLRLDPEIEEFKFVKSPSRKVEFKAHNVDGLHHFQKRRSVSFASPPALMINSKYVREVPTETSPRNKSKKTMKKKPLIPLFGGLFLKNLGANKQ